MPHLSKTNTRYPIFRFLFSITMLSALAGGLYLPGPVAAEDVTDPIIRLSSENAPACSGDDAASCFKTFFKAELTHTASFVFDCSGTDVDIPILKGLALIFGIEIPPYIPLPTTPVPACSLFAEGSTFTISDVTEGKIIKEVTYPGRSEDQFVVEQDHVYELSLMAHGRDFRDALEANNWGTFDSFAEVAYQEIDPNDDLCLNAVPFDLPYAGNLEFSGDHDWQEIQSPVKGTMVLTLDVPDGKDYQLEVYSADCNAVWVGTPHGPGEDETVEVPVNWGPYHVHISGKNADDYGAWYGVSATFSGDLGDNQCTSAALFNLPYSGDLEYRGDHDWQRIQSPVKGMMVLNLDVPEGKDYQLEVWNDDCNAIWAGTPHGPGEDEVVEVPVDWAFYRVHVFGKTPDDFNGWYGISAAFSGDLNDNQWEKAAHFDLPFNGNLEYSGDEDWQRINIPNQVVYLVLDVPDGKNYNLELWRDDAKVRLSDSRNDTGFDERILISGPGAYRIRVNGVDPATDFNAPYGVFLDADVPVTLVKDIAEGGVPSSFSELININGVLYFVADHVLWKSDGTEEGTVKVVASGGSFNKPHDLTNGDGKLYFAASPGEDIWMTDGTPDGTTRLNLTYNPGSLSELKAANDMLYFVWRDCGGGSSLCDILMSLSGEISRETVAQHPAIPAYSHLTDVDGTLFYVHADYRSAPTNPPAPPKVHWQLMKLTSADQDPVAVGDIPGDESNPPEKFHAAGGILYFVANDGMHGPKVWRSDGTSIEMVPAVAGHMPQIGSAYGVPDEITDINGDVYFTDGRALWAINDAGSAAGIFCVAPSSSCAGSIMHLGVVGGMLYFVHSWEFETTLFRYDGNIVTAVRKYPAITNPLFFPTIDHLTDVGGRLFFVVNDGIHGAELWTSDGTPSGSIMVADIAPGINSSDPDHLTDASGMLFFTANDTIHGTELWRTVVDNRSPTAEVNGPYTIEEGSLVTLDASASADPDGDPLTFEWDLDNDGSFDDAAGVTAAARFPDDGRYPVNVRATDPSGAQSTDYGMVHVLNVAPTIPNPINTTGVPAPINTSLGFSASFTDPGILDTYTALWDWGDGTTSPGLVSGYNVTGTHSYNKAGLFTVTLSIADDDGGTAAKFHQYVVVVDPKAGFVTGGGWFRYSNKIGQFGFIAHYPPRDTLAPVGSVVFQVPASRFVFHSSQFDWLVIDGSKATLRGAGKINGKGSYPFLLTVTNGSPDSIRIKIWDQATGLVIYDTQPGASDTADPTISIKGGSIRIHKPK